MYLNKFVRNSKWLTPLVRLTRKIAAQTLRTLNTNSHKTYSPDQSDSLTIQTIQKQHIESVTNHLRNHFVPNEPLNLVYGIGQDERTMNTMLLEYVHDICDGLSLLALSGKRYDKVAGVAINGRTLRGVEIEPFNAPQTPLEKQMHLLHEQNTNLKLFERFGVSEYLDMRALSVDPLFQGRGLSKYLLKYCEEVAVLAGFRLIRTDATSLYSQRAFASCGYETLTEVRYDALPNFQRMDPADAPHQSVKIMVKRVGSK